MAPLRSYLGRLPAERVTFRELLSCKSNFSSRACGGPKVNNFFSRPRQAVPATKVTGRYSPLAALAAVFRVPGFPALRVFNRNELLIEKGVARFEYAYRYHW